MKSIGKVRRLFFVICFFCILSPLTLAEVFSSHVDKTNITEGSFITLTLEYDGSTQEQPDISPLEKDFTILSRQQSSQKTFENGNYRAKMSWVFEIMPKKSAQTLVIPALTLGNKSSIPITITQTRTSSEKKNDDISLTVTTDHKQVYVNAEVILTIMIKTALSLRNATLSKLEIKDAIIESLVEDNRSELVENGIKYIVFKQIFAIYPSRPGTLVIPSVLFKGSAVGERRGFFSHSSPVTAQSEAISLEVKDIPKEYPADQPFFPVKSFVVIESFDESNPTFEINKAISRHFEMKAKGTLVSFLPTLAIPSVKNMQIYNESGTKLQKNEEDGMMTSTKFSHVYMPTGAGDVTVPEQTIYWWDTDADKLRTTVIRPLQLHVKGDEVAAPLKDALKENPKEEQQVPAEPKTSNDNFVWKIVALSLSLLWIATLVVFFLRKRWKVNTPVPSSNEKEFRVQAIVKACDALDAKVVYVQGRALSHWAHRMGVQKNIVELDDLITKLEHSLYNKEEMPLAEILFAIKDKVKKISIDKPKKTTLAPLYPQ